MFVYIVSIILILFGGVSIFVGQHLKDMPLTTYGIFWVLVGTLFLL